LRIRKQEKIRVASVKEENYYRKAIKRAERVQEVVFIWI
jgi:hypothetical protein